VAWSDTYLGRTIIKDSSMSDQISFTGLKRQYENLRTELLDVTDSVLRTGQVMNGEQTNRFEQWLCERNQSKYAVTCHSGTQALEIIASYIATSASIPPVALIPSVSFRATANAMIRSGWDLHFVDVDSYGQFRRDNIPQLISYQATVIVGLYGLYPTMARRPSRDRVIEDAAQHWLAGPPLGNRAISFDPTKNLGNFGNGGAVITNDHSLYVFAKHWCNNNLASVAATDVDVIGTNSRMSEVDCAQLLVKSQYIDAWQQRRRTIATYWIKRFADKPGIRCLVNNKNINRHALQKFVISVGDQNQLAEKLKQAGIETKVHYEKPLHEMYRQYPGPGLLSAASALCRTVLSLPIYPELTDSEVEYIADQVLAGVDS